MDATGYEYLQLEEEADGVLVVTLGDPDRLNAVSEQGHSELVELWPEADRDSDVKVILVRSNGRRSRPGGPMR